MTFQKGHTAWNKGNKRTVKAKNEPELFENNAPLDSEPIRVPVELSAEPNEARRKGFFSRLFSWFK